MRTQLFFLSLTTLLAIVIARGDDKATLPYQQIGTLDESIRESSGVAESRQHEGIFWTHNDGGGKARLFAITREGKLVKTFQVKADVSDWEDIAADDAGHLYVADTGNNDADEKEIHVYQIDEPDPRDKPRVIKPTRTWRLRYPRKPFDCESLFIWKDFGYVIAKFKDGREAELYRFPLDLGEKLELEFVATLPLTMPVTSADLSRDGAQLAVLGPAGLYVFDVSTGIGDVEKIPPRRMTNTYVKSEGCCFTSDGILVTSETREVLFYPLPRAATQPAK